MARCIRLRRFLELFLVLPWLSTTAAGKPALPPDPAPLRPGPDRRGQASETTEMTNVGAVQRALNQARKAENRNKKATTDLALAHKKWNQFKEDAKKADMEQQRRYQADVQRLQKEVDASLLTLKEAQLRVKEAVTKEKAAPVDAADDAFMDDGSWDALIQDAGEPGDYSDGDVWHFLQKSVLPPGCDRGQSSGPTSGKEAELRSQMRALQQQLAAVTGNGSASGCPATPATGGLPHTPPAVRGPPRMVGTKLQRVLPGGSAAMQPFYNSLDRNAALKDPHHTSPSANVAAHAALFSVPAVTNAATPTALRRAVPGTGIGPKGRVPIKEVGKQATTPKSAGNGTLADAVQLRRDRLTAEALNASPLVAGHQVAIDDDDHDVEEEPVSVNGVLGLME